MHRRTFVPVAELDRIKTKLEREREARKTQPVREPVARRVKKRRLVPAVR